MPRTSTLFPHLAMGPVDEPVAGVIGGVVAGLAYLAAQVSFAALVHPGSGAEPLQRIAAILMGPDVAPPPAGFSFTVLGMALIIHLGLAMVFGRIVGKAVWRRAPGPALLIGALIGVALYALDFGVIAPQAFPWFADALRAATAVDHALFGAVCAGVCILLRPPLQAG